MILIIKYLDLIIWLLSCISTFIIEIISIFIHLRILSSSLKIISFSYTINLFFISLILIFYYFLFFILISWLVTIFFSCFACLISIFLALVRSFSLIYSWYFTLSIRSTILFELFSPKLWTAEVKFDAVLVQDPIFLLIKL